MFIRHKNKMYGYENIDIMFEVETVVSKIKNGKTVGHLLRSGKITPREMCSHFLLGRHIGTRGDVTVIERLLARL